MEADGPFSMGLARVEIQIDFQYGSRESLVTLKETDSIGVEFDV